MMIKRVIAGIVLLLLGMTATVYGLSLFTQTFPVIPATNPVLTSNCTMLIGAPPSIAPGSNGTVSFGCGTAIPAFKVVNDGAATPAFMPNPLPAPYGSVSLIQSASGPSPGCAVSASTTLRNGALFSFTGALGGGNSYNYCVSYTNASGQLPTFQISWSQ